MSLERAKKRLGNLGTILETQQAELRKLEKVAISAEEERVAQKKEVQAVISEKSILTQQLIKRNEELNTRYEQLKIQQSKLLHGENEYKAVCNCIFYFTSTHSFCRALL